ncbi:MAG: class I SAM-dependent methyltransferase [Anaerolineales bacterium]|nr:class I SAM-dependent methyltransferase [Anaerolineales bacterium]
MTWTSMQRDPENKESKMLHQFADFSGKRVLEVGCGEGRLTWKYAKHAKQVVAFDIDHNAIRIARADAVLNACQHVLFFNSSAKHIPLEKESFDIVIGALSLCCIDDEDKLDALSEIQRLLKPNGIFIDLRALESNWRVEICDSQQYQVAGPLNDAPEGLAHDEGANQAMREVESKGWYIKEKESEFDFFYYWDTPSEMKEFLESEWEDFEKIDEAVYRKTNSLWVSARADARVRMRVKMIITKWISGKIETK